MMQEGSRRACGKHGFFALLLIVATLVCAAPIAQAQVSSPSAAPTLAPVVVTGELPGPALWKVSKGQHVMWILGLVTPVPRYMRWKSEEVEKRIAAAQAVLKPPGLEIGTDPSAARELAVSVKNLRNNPNYESLEHVLQPALYQRWRVQKEHYLENGNNADHLRPIFAGLTLYNAVLRKKGMVEQTAIEKKVYETARHHDVAIIDPAYQLALNDPRAAIDTLKQNPMDDQNCLSTVLDAVDHDLAQTTARANAWATGDLDGLKAVLMQTQEGGCLSGIDTSPFAKAAGMSGMQQHIDQSWLAHAKQALTQNTQTFALLPMEQLFMPNGYLSALQAEGYTVQAQDE